MDTITRVTAAMIQYYDGDVRRINHFLKVYGFAKTIAGLEAVDPETLQIIEIAALIHDIGIRNSERKYGSSSGEYQQTEGPPEAKKLLETLGMAAPVTERVCWLIAHHHTYGNIQGVDYQILVEADFLVNIHEDGLSLPAIQEIGHRIFATVTGRTLLRQLYG